MAEEVVVAKPKLTIEGAPPRGAGDRLAGGLQRTDGTTEPVLVWRGLGAPVDATDSQLEADGQLLARLRHANVLRTLSFDRLNGRPVLVTETFEGASLRQVLTDLQKRGESVPVGVAVAITSAVAAGLAAATAVEGEDGRTLGHRGPSAEHVLIDASGAVKVVGLTVLGPARPLALGTPGGSTSADAGEAPEATSQLGVLLVALLVGLQPGVHHDLPGRGEEAVGRARSAVRMRLGARPFEGVEALIGACLAPRPGDRPPLGEVAARLQGFLPPTSADDLAEWAQAVVPGLAKAGGEVSGGPESAPLIGGEDIHPDAPVGKVAVSFGGAEGDVRAVGLSISGDGLRVERGPAADRPLSGAAIHDTLPGEGPAASSGRPVGWGRLAIGGLIAVAVATVAWGVALRGPPPEAVVDPTPEDAGATVAEDPPEPPAPVPPAPVPPALGPGGEAPPVDTPPPSSAASPPAPPASTAPTAPAGSSGTRRSSATTRTGPDAVDAPRIGPSPPSPAADTPPQSVTPEAPASPPPPTAFEVEFRSGDPDVVTMDVRCRVGSVQGKPPVTITDAERGPCKVVGLVDEGPPLVAVVSLAGPRRYTCFTDGERRCD